MESKTLKPQGGSVDIAWYIIPVTGYIEHHCMGDYRLPHLVFHSSTDRLCTTGHQGSVVQLQTEQATPEITHILLVGKLGEENEVTHQNFHYCTDTGLLGTSTRTCGVVWWAKLSIGQLHFFAIDGVGAL